MTSTPPTSTAAVTTTAAVQTMTMTTDPTTATLITTTTAADPITTTLASQTSGPSQSPITSIASPVTPPASVTEGIIFYSSDCMLSNKKMILNTMS